jgi:hypothetical protein
VAKYVCVTSTHRTLAAATVDTVLFSGGAQAIQVTNRDAAALIYFRVDGVAPAVAADETYLAMPGQTVTVRIGTAVPTQVQLISAGTPAYSATLVHRAGEVSTL